MSKIPVIYFPEGFADWEGAFLLPELREARRPFAVVSENGQPVVSIGGLKTSVDGSLTSISPDEIEALILIGSDSWTDNSKNTKVLDLAASLLEKDVLIAGICGASLALVRKGLTTGRRHTSNDLGFLKYFLPDYSDEKNYAEERVVVDRNLITAPGTGYLEFTREVLKYLGVYTEEKRSQWYELYRAGTKPPPEFWNS